MKAFHEISKDLSRKPKGYKHNPRFKEGIWNGEISMIRDGLILTGLLPLILYYIQERGYTYEVLDQRVDPIIDTNNLNKVNLKGKSLRKYQWQALTQIIQQKRGVVDAATNAGKTVIAAGAIQALGIKTLFLTHRQELFTQTEDSLEGALGIEIGRIWEDSMDLDNQVVMAMVPTLHRRLKPKKGEIDAKVLEYLQSVQMVIIDESHHCVASTYEDILTACDGAYYRIGLSGTPFVYEDKTKILKSIGLLGYSIFNIRNKQLIEEGVSSKPNINMYKVLTEIEKNDYQEAYNEGIVYCTERNSIILREVRDFMERGLPTLIIVNYEEHGNHLRHYLTSNGCNPDDVQFISGNTKNKKHRKKYFEAFKDGKLPVLISTLIVQEGVSMESIGALVFALGGKSDTRVLQCLGRGLRQNKFGNEVEVVDFIDCGHDKLLTHSLSRHETYENEDFGDYMNAEPIHNDCMQRLRRVLKKFKTKEE